MKFSLTPTENQIQLLRHVADNPGYRPEGQQSNTVWALLQRQLITRTWSKEGQEHLTISKEGRYFLKHGRHPKEVEQERERNARDPHTAKAAPADGAELMQRLEAERGAVTVPDPGTMTRGRWSRAFYHAVNNGLVPQGHKLRLSGRERADLVIRLVSVVDEPQPEPPSVIEVPDGLLKPHPLVAATKKVVGRSQKGIADTRGHPNVIPMYVSRPLVDRALRIMNALFVEAERRGYAVEVRTGPPTRRSDEPANQVSIIVQGHAFPLEICERTTKVPHEPTARELKEAEAQSAWSRKRLPKYDHVLDGRLLIDRPGHDTYYGSRHYDCSDGVRWTLESRLGHLLATIENRAAEAEKRRIEEAEAEERRRQKQLEALAEAHQRLIHDTRWQHLKEILKARRMAGEIRELCTAVRAQAGQELPKETAAWLDWADAQADAIDPAKHSLTFPPDPVPSRKSLEPYLDSSRLRAYPWPYQDA